MGWQLIIAPSAQAAVCASLLWIQSKILNRSSPIPEGGRIPTGFRPKAQGCEARATLGYPGTMVRNPNGVVASRARCRNPVGVGVVSNDIPRVARAFRTGTRNPGL